MLVTCKECNQEVSSKAKTCPHCGCPRLKFKDVGFFEFEPLYAVLSLLIPGLGQLVKLQILNALVWFIVVVCLYSVYLFPGIIAHILCIAGAGIPKK